jgi:hypothetical protein
MTDIVTMQVIRYALEQIADEMGHTLVRRRITRRACSQASRSPCVSW